jgi:uncharacterized protein
MSSVQPPPESASRAGRLDRILRDLLHQTPGVEAAAVVSFDGLPMASALPPGMDEDRVAAMSAALLSLAERAAQGLGRGDLSQVYIEGEHGTVFLVSAQDEGVLIAVTAAGAKVGMMLYEVKLAANRVGEVLHGPAPLPAPLPAHVTRGYLEEQVAPPVAEPPVADQALTTIADVAASYAQPSPYGDSGYAEPSYAGPSVLDQPSYAEAAPAVSYLPADETPTYGDSSPDNAVEAAPAVPVADAWSSYAPSGSILPGERNSWS